MSFLITYREGIFMNTKNTEEINEIIKTVRAKEISDFLAKEVRDNLPSISEFFSRYLQDHHLLAAQVIKDSNMSPDYAYAIMNGNRKNPARDRVIALCLAMHMSLDEAQQALKLCKTFLYAKDKRDAVIIVCFNQRIFDVNEVNLILSDFNLKELETTKP